MFEEGEEEVAGKGNRANKATQKRPTIKDFWGTKQKEMVLPSLVALAAVGGEAGEVMVVDDDDDEEVRAKGAMNAVLLRSDNVSG